ncbi:unnamed protein product [Spirodela intermedia]|uniref:Uncharacterized protein n=1 Tax=Spirodela intermedia TaxID=51605 RepID=A0A7I8K6B4_SPIIN|nr:unnamed protein product [Spirodela intermedia]
MWKGSGHWPDWPMELVLEQIYLKGLKQEIKFKLSITKPMSLLEIMDNSLEAEEHLHTLCEARHLNLPK